MPFADVGDAQVKAAGQDAIDDRQRAGSFHPDLQFRIGGNQPRNRRSDRNFEGKRSGADRQFANFDPLHQADLALQFTLLGDDLPAAFENEAAIGGWFHAATGPVEELHAQCLLEVGNAAR